MVFDTNKAPRDRAEFMIWYKKLVQWDEDRDYDSLEGTCVELQNWYNAMIKEFPPMNGPHGVSDDEADGDLVTGYTIASEAIYVDFRWSVSEQAYNRVVNLGLDHAVGFFDVSANEGDILYDANDYYDLMGL